MQTLFNTALPESGATLASPVNGAIVRWRVQGAKGGPFYLRVLHPNGKGAYEAAGTSLPATPAGEGLQTFSTNLKIQAGDLIGIDPSNDTDEIGIAVTSGASYASIFPTPFDGSIVAPSETFSGSEIELSAEVQPQPEITSISPPSGSVTGGTLVTITGKNLSGTTSVKFGASSGGQLHGRFRHRNHRHRSEQRSNRAKSTSARPPSRGRTSTPASTTSSTRPAWCRALKNKTLKKAKTLLRRNGCKLGHVKKIDVPKPKKVGKVLKQAPKPGKVLAPGARVRINLGKEPAQGSSSNRRRGALPSRRRTPPR